MKKEDENQLNDLKREALKKRAGEYEYTTSDGKIIKGSTGLKGGVIRRSFDEETAKYAKMSKSDLEKEKIRLKAISDNAYQTFTKVSASRSGSQVDTFTNADVKLAKINKVLKRENTVSRGAGSTSTSNTQLKLMGGNQMADEEIRTDNTETLINALERIAELEEKIDKIRNYLAYDIPHELINEATNKIWHMI